MFEKVLKFDDKCQQCEHGILMLVKNNFPFEDHLQCDCCDSTFILEEHKYD